MNLTLPQRIYLMAYSPAKNDFTTANLQFRGQRLRAAALTELVDAGLIGTDAGKAIRLGTEPPADTFLAQVWGQVSADKPERWLELIHNEARTAEAPMRSQLLTAGVIREPEHRRLGPLGPHHVVLTAPEQVLALREATRSTVLSDSDPTAVPLDDLVTALLCTEGEASVLFDGRERRAHKQTLTAFAHRFDDFVPGLRNALLTSIVSHRAVGGGWS